MITTIAGGGDTFGDNGPATNAQLWTQASIAVDSAGNVYVGDIINSRVRVLRPMTE